MDSEKLLKYSAVAIEEEKNKDKSSPSNTTTKNDNNQKRLNFTFQKLLFTILLTSIGGVADTITYTTCGLFCGHITGNFILLPKEQILFGSIKSTSKLVCAPVFLVGASPHPPSLHLLSLKMKFEKLRNDT